MTQPEVRIVTVAFLWCTSGCGLIAAPESSLNAPVEDFQYTYVIDRWIMPQDLSEAGQLYPDADDDGQPEYNTIGGVLADLASFGVAAASDRAFDRGDILTLLAITGDGAGYGDVDVFRGYAAAPAPCAGPTDRQCARHLDGGASFALFDVYGPVSGQIASGAFTGVSHSGALEIKLALIEHIDLDVTGNPYVFELELHNPRFALTGLKASSTRGVLSGGIAQQDVKDMIIPQIAAVYTTAIERNCGSGAGACGCAKDSWEEAAAIVWDHADGDCKISRDEVLGSAYADNILEPDAGNFVSFAIEFTAVRATGR